MEPPDGDAMTHTRFVFTDVPADGGMVTIAAYKPDGRPGARFTVAADVADNIMDALNRRDRPATTAPPLTYDIVLTRIIGALDVAVQNETLNRDELAQAIRRAIDPFVTVGGTARPLARASMESVCIRDFALKFSGMRMPAALEQYLRAAPCVNCNKPASDMHHVFGSVGGMKSADVYRVPVCRPCHTEHENSPAFRDYCIAAWVMLVGRFLSDVAVGMRPAVGEGFNR
jgi:hypothetical protein